MGREIDGLSLRQFSRKGQEEGADMIGNDAFTEIYMETAPGNVYRLQESRDGSWWIVSMRENAGKGRGAKGYKLTEAELETGLLKVGQPFTFGQGGKTTEISKITAVAGNRVYQKEFLDKMTEGRSSNIRNRFSDAIKGEK